MGFESRAGAERMGYRANPPPAGLVPTIENPAFLSPLIAARVVCCCGNPP